MIRRAMLGRAAVVIGILIAGRVSAQPEEAAQGHGRELSVVTYNILEGFTNSKSERFPAGSDRQIRVSQWLASQKPAIVAFQELNGYTEERLAKESRAWGHGYAATVKESGYIVGLTSREPIEVIGRHLEGMHHGVLHVRTMGIECFVVHLSPFRFKHRQEEATMIIQQVQNATDAGYPVLVLGDFNALSPQDRAVHDTDLKSLERMKASDLKHDHIENLNKGQFDYTVMRTFLDAGLVDLVAQHRKTSVETGNKRIDFILSTTDLAEHLQSATHHDGDTFRAMSDHPPVSAQFALPNDPALCLKKER